MTYRRVTATGLGSGRNGLTEPGGYTWRGRRPVNPCACGCGEEAPIAAKTDVRHGRVKGQPVKYISGHNPGPARKDGAA